MLCVCLKSLPLFSSLPSSLRPFISDKTDDLKVKLRQTFFFFFACFLTLLFKNFYYLHALEVEIKNSVEQKDGFWYCQYVLCCLSQVSVSLV